MDTRVLDEYAASLVSGRDIQSVLDEFVAWLARERTRRTSQEWSALCRVVAGHRMADLLRTEPITARGRNKPRGYAGDAVIMDLIYGMGDPPLHDGMSRALHTGILQRPAMRGARWRRQAIRERVDGLARERPGARVASLAAGHLREAEDSIALRKGALSRYWALDQDRESLAQVSRDYGKFGVRGAPEHVRDIIGRGGLRQAPLDLITSTGLYDYLPDRTARPLTSALLRSLTPGGRLLTANVTPQFHDAGYFEAVMDWPLIQRNAHHMLALLEPSVLPHVADIHLFQDPDRVIIFLAATRQ